MFGFVAESLIELGLDEAIEDLKLLPSHLDKAIDVLKALAGKVQGTPPKSLPKLYPVNTTIDIEWIDKGCKNNKKLYDVNGNIIVIGNPSSKIHTMCTYDIHGDVVEDASVKVKAVRRKVIFMEPNSKDMRDEIKKLKKLHKEGYLSKERYNSLMRDLKNQ